jgi:cytochrome P450
VIVTEPELVRQVLSNKFGHFEKAGFGQLTRLLHHGVSTHQGSKWAKHRRIINPAFHLDKLKVSTSQLNPCPRGMHTSGRQSMFACLKSQLMLSFSIDSCSACSRPLRRAAPTW